MREARIFKHELKACIRKYLDTLDAAEAAKAIIDMNLAPDQVSPGKPELIPQCLSGEDALEVLKAIDYSLFVLLCWCGRILKLCEKHISFLWSAQMTPNRLQKPSWDSLSNCGHWASWIRSALSRVWRRSEIFFPTYAHVAARAASSDECCLRVSLKRENRSIWQPQKLSVVVLLLCLYQIELDVPNAQQKICYMVAASRNKGLLPADYVFAEEVVEDGQ